MDANTTNAVKQDFLAWSGGFPPDSEQDIFIYIEYAYGADRTDADEAREMLRDWMRNDLSDSPGM